MDPNEILPRAAGRVKLALTDLCLVLCAVLALVGPGLGKAEAQTFTKSFAFETVTVNPFANYAEATLTYAFSDLPTESHYTYAFSDYFHQDPLGITIGNVRIATNTCRNGRIVKYTGDRIVAYEGFQPRADGSCSVSFIFRVTAYRTGTTYTTTADRLRRHNALRSLPARAYYEYSPYITTERVTLTVNLLPLTYTKSLKNNTIPVNGTTDLVLGFHDYSEFSNRFFDTNPSTYYFTHPRDFGGAAEAVDFLNTNCVPIPGELIPGLHPSEITGRFEIRNGSCKLQIGLRGISPGIYDLPVTMAERRHTGDDGSVVDTLVASTLGNFRLTVFAAPEFRLSPVTQASESTYTLTFEIDNAANEASLMSARDLHFETPYALPSGLRIADPPNASVRCPGGIDGTLTAAANDSTIDYRGGQAAAGGSCTFEVDFMIDAGEDTSGTFSRVLRPPTLNSSLGSAEANPITFLRQRPFFGQLFSPSYIQPGEPATLTFSIWNQGSATAMDLNFSDELPAGLILVDPAAEPVRSPECLGGAVETSFSTSIAISYGNGAVAAGTTCTIEVSVTANADGRFQNDPVTLDSTLYGYTAESRSGLTVLGVSSRPVFTQAFVPDVIQSGSVSALTFTIDNIANVASIHANFSDELPAGVSLAPDATVNRGPGCRSGVLRAEGRIVSWLGDTAVNPRTVCTISVPVTSSAAGIHVNEAVSLTALVNDEPFVGEAPSAALTVTPRPLFTQSFAPSMITMNGVSTLTFSIENAGTVAATNVTFSDELPAGVNMASGAIAVVGSGCSGGGASASTSDGVLSVSYSEGAVAPGATCEISVRVTSSAPGVYDNDAPTVSYFLNDQGPFKGEKTSASLTVVEGPVFTQSFVGDTIAQNGISTLTFSIENRSTVAAADVSFSDVLPGGLTLAPSVTLGSGTTAVTGPGCGSGTASASASGGVASVSFENGMIAAEATCTIGVRVTSAVTGRHENAAVTLRYSMNDMSSESVASSASLTVVDGLTFSQTFSPTTITPNVTSTLKFKIENTATVAATGVSFTDALPAGVTPSGGAPTASSGCGGGAPSASGGTISWLGGNVAAGAICTIGVPVTSSTNGIHENAAVGMDYTLNDVAFEAQAAPTLLTVTDAATFSQTFSPTTITPNQTSILTFSISNVGSIDAIDVGFTDALPDGVTLSGETPTASSECNGNVPSTSDGTVSWSNGRVAAGTTCMIAVSVTSATPRVHENAAVELDYMLNDAALEARTEAVLLTVTDEAAFSQTFSPVVIAPNGTSTLTFSISNPGSVDAADVGFSDALPAGVTLSGGAPTVSSGCGGAAPSTSGGTVSWSGGGVAAGATCTIAVSVTSAVRRDHENAAVELDYTLNGGAFETRTGTALLTVTDEAAFSQTFSPATIAPNGTSTLTFTISNPGSVDVAGMGFTDALPVGVTLSGEAPTASSGCNGKMPSASDGAISWLSGSVAAGGTCTIGVSVTSSARGVHENDAVQLGYTLNGATFEARTEAALLTVTDTPAFAQSFDEGTIAPDGTSTLTFTISNPGSVDAADVAFSDAPPVDVTLSGGVPTASSGCGGAVPSVSGGTVSWSGGNVAAGATCTIGVSVTSSARGVHENDPVELDYTLNDTAFESRTGTATLTVTDTPAFTQSFDEDTITLGGTSTLTFTISNAGSVDAADVAFVGAPSAGVALSGSAPTVSLGCGGAAPSASGGTVSWSGGSVAAGATCVIAVSVTSSARGVRENDAVELDYTLNGAAFGSRTETATLTVTDAVTFGQSFRENTIAPNGTSTLTFTILNPGSVSATGVAFDGDLPVGVTPSGSAPTVSAGCGGSAPSASGGTVSWSGGSVAAGATCTIGVSVTSSAMGDYENAAVEMDYRLNDAAFEAQTMPATLTVADKPVFTQSFEEGTIVPNGTSTLTFRIENLSSIDAADVAFGDAPPAGVTLSGSAPTASSGCGGNAPSVSGGTVSWSGGTIAAGATCTIEVSVTSSARGIHKNAEVDLGYSLNDVAFETRTAMQALLTVTDEAVFTQAFAEGTIEPNGTTKLKFTISNPGSVDAFGVTFSDAPPAGAALSSPLPATSPGCWGSMPSVSGETVSWSNGRIQAGATCTIGVSITAAARSAAYENPAVELDYMLNDAEFETQTPASAMLTVTDTPVFFQMFSPTVIAPNGTSTLMFLIMNPGSVDAANVSFSGAPPDGVTLSGSAPTVSSGCGGSAPSTSGGGVSWSGGSVAAGSTCTIRVSVTSAAGGDYGSAPVDLDYTLNGTAFETRAETAVLTVTNVATFSQTFSPTKISPNGTSMLTFTISNPGSVDAADAAFTDALPAGVTLSGEAPVVGTGCGGGAPSASGRTVSWSGGRISAGATCTIEVSVTASEEGNHENTPVALGYRLSGTAFETRSGTATLTVVPPPVFSASFVPDSVFVGEASKLILKIDNGDSSVEIPDLSLSDVSLPSGATATVASPGYEGDCGSVPPTAGSGTVSWSGGAVAAEAVCKLHFDVTFGEASLSETGAFKRNAVSVDLTSATLGELGTATAEVEVNPLPDFVGAFDPTTVAVGGRSKLTFTIDAGGSNAEISGLSFADVSLPSGATAAVASPGSDGDCGPALPTAGSGTVSWSGGALAAGAVCKFHFDVTFAETALPPDMTSAESAVSVDLVSATLGGIGTATATATVTAEKTSPAFRQAFIPNLIEAGTVSTLTFTIVNEESVPAGRLAFTEALTLPSTVAVADPPEVSAICPGGTDGALKTTAGGSTIMYSGGEMAADGSCTLSVDVVSDAGGAHESPAVRMISSLGSVRADSTTLKVSGPPGFGKRFDPDSIVVGKVSTLIYTVDNSGAELDAAELAFADVFPASTLTVADPARADSTCAGGTLTAVPGQAEIRYSGGTVEAGESCTISVAVTSDAEGEHESESGELTSSLGSGGTATATLRVALVDAVEKTRRVIRAFMADRADVLTAEEPSLVGRLTERYAGGRGNPLGFAAGGEPGNLNMSFHTSLGALDFWSRGDGHGTSGAFGSPPKTAGGSTAGDAWSPDEGRMAFDIWVKGKYARVRNASRRSDVGLLWLGADYLFSPDLVLGLIGQADWVDHDDRAENAEVRGIGWMAGPYVVARLLDNLIFDGRAALGLSENEVNPLGGYTDDFRTIRWLARGQLTGAFDISGLSFSPFVQALYFEETQLAYKDSLGNFIPKQRISFGRMKFGPRLSASFTGKNGFTVSPHVTVSGLFDFDRAGRVEDDGPGAEGGFGSRLRGRVEGGLGISMRGGWSFGGEGFYDGIGRGSFESYGGNLNVTIPFTL